MPVSAWLDQNWFSLLQTIGIAGGLVFTAFALRADEKARRIQNHFSITEQHRKVWSLLFSHPELGRVLMRDLDLGNHPVTDSEDLFVTLLILNLKGSFIASKAGLFVSSEKLGTDIKGFLSLPIPGKVWEGLKSVQDDAFVRFVDSALNKAK